MCRKIEWRNIIYEHDCSENAKDEPVNYKEHVGEIIDSQREGTRAIRKDVVLVDEWIITSNQEFFKDLSESETRRFFEESVAFDSR